MGSFFACIFPPDVLHNFNDKWSFFYSMLLQEHHRHTRRQDFTCVPDVDRVSGEVHLLFCLPLDFTQKAPSKVVLLNTSISLFSAALFLYHMSLFDIALFICLFIYLATKMEVPQGLEFISVLFITVWKSTWKHYVLKMFLDE